MPSVTPVPVDGTMPSFKHIHRACARVFRIGCLARYTFELIRALPLEKLVGHRREMIRSQHHVALGTFSKHTTPTTMTGSRSGKCCKSQCLCARRQAAGCASTAPPVTSRAQRGRSHDSAMRGRVEVSAPHASCVVVDLSDDRMRARSSTTTPAFMCCRRATVAANNRPRVLQHRSGRLVLLLVVRTQRTGNAAITSVGVIRLA
jgi:hypothetical protein